MVEIRTDTVIEIPDLQWAGLFDSFSRSYDEERDILFVSRLPKRPGISLDFGGLLWVRYDPEDGEVLGFEIEDFERVFVAKFPELGVSWNEVKPLITKRKTNNASQYIQILLRLIQGIVRQHPYQEQMAL